MMSEGKTIGQLMEEMRAKAGAQNYHGHGFRPQRSVEHAIQSTYRLIQRSNLHYIVEFDIKAVDDGMSGAVLV